MALASPTQPLVLADGTKIDPSTGEVIKDLPPIVEVPSNTETQRELAYTRRTLRDLPEVPAKMNVVSVVLSYELFGLQPQDIAIATGLPVAQIKAIQKTDVYESYKQDILRRFEETEAATVRELFAKKAMAAANKVVSIMETTENDGLAMKASQDVLDRAGHRPVDVVMHRHSVEGGLQITYINSADETIPSKDVIEGEVVDAG